jgi:hypothetical protein
MSGSQNVSIVIECLICLYTIGNVIEKSCKEMGKRKESFDFQDSPLSDEWNSKSSSFYS